MEGVWKFNPFYWLALRRFSHTQPTQPKLKLRYLSPFRWSKRTVRSVTASFFMIMMPIYVLIGAQPISPIEAAGYPELSIPSLKLTTPVEPIELIDHQLNTPSQIAGSYRQHDNKTLLIGHSSSVFQDLAKVNIGDQLTYANHDYIITGYSVLEKSAIDMSEILAPADQETLILMTCAGTPLPDQDATHRLIVTAIITDSTSSTASTTL